MSSVNPSPAVPREHEIQVRVRYQETDGQGRVHHTNYINYFEVARVEMLRSSGKSYRELESEGIMLVVSEVGCKYYRGAMDDQLLTIKTSLRHLPEQFITFHYEIFNEKGKLLNGATVRLCFMDIKTKKRIPTPEYLRKALDHYFVS